MATDNKTIAMTENFIIAIGDPVYPHKDLPPKGGQREFRDSGSPMLLKVTRGTNGSVHRRFFLRVKIHGKRKFHTLWDDKDPRPLPSLADLRASAHTLRNTLAGEGAHTVQNQDAAGKTLSDAFDAYQALRVSQGEKKQKSADRARGMFDLHVPAHVQQLPALHVDENVITGVVAGVTPSKKGARITGETTKDEVQKLLVPVVNWMRKPVKGMDKLDEDRLPRRIKPRVRKIQTGRTPERFQADVQTLLQFAMSRVATKVDEGAGIDQARAEGMRQTGRLVLLMATTGMRSTEARSLRWEWIDLEAKILHIPGEFTKNGSDLVLPLTRWQTSLLRDQTNASDYVFPSKIATGKVPFEGDGGLRAFFEQLDKATAKQKDANDKPVPGTGLVLTPHQLRKIYSTFARKICGVPSATIDTLTNHIPRSVTEDHYIDADFGVDLDLLRPSVDLIVGKMVSLLQQEKRAAA